MSYSGSRDTPGSNLRCNCSASERVSRIVWNATATLCERLSDALGIGFLARAFLTTDLDFFGATALRRVFAIMPFLLEVFAFFVAFEAVLLRVFLAIVDPQCRTTLFSEHRRRMGHRARGAMSAWGPEQTSAVRAPMSRFSRAQQCLLSGEDRSAFCQKQTFRKADLT
jgi:hypothetical protein